MQSQHIVNNRILGQLSADELKSVQPWLTLMALRYECRAARGGAPARAGLFSRERHDLVASGHANRRSHRKPALLAPMVCSEGTPPSMDMHLDR